MRLCKTWLRHGEKTLLERGKGEVGGGEEWGLEGDHSDGSRMKKTSNHHSSSGGLGG